MLRRRIFSSAMASVMALSSIAVVANAEETTVYAVKEKADLEALVKQYDEYRNGKIDDYGSVSGENFLNAIEYADNVLADDEATFTDYTAAYSMLEAVVNNLTIYTQQELKDLIAKSTKAYESNNIYNEDLGDNIYTPGSFETLVGAYENAVAFVDSSDSRNITDAYEELDAAFKGLSELGKVTKAEFRTALKAYETALQNEFKYDAWRVGKINHSAWYYNGQNAAYGTVYTYVQSAETEINAQYEILDEIKTLSITSQTDIVNAYTACKELTELLNRFEADDTNRATKANVKTLLNEYHGRLVYDYAQTSANALYEAVVKVVGAKNIHNKLKINEYTAEIDDKVAAVANGADAWCTFGGNVAVNPTGTSESKWDKLSSAELAIKTDAKFYIATNAAGEAIGVAEDDEGKNAQWLIPTTGKDIVKEMDMGDYDMKFQLFNLDGKQYWVPLSWDQSFADIGYWGILDSNNILNYDAINFSTKAIDWNDCLMNGEAKATYAEKKADLVAAQDTVLSQEIASWKRVNERATIDLVDYVGVAVEDVVASVSETDNHEKNTVCDGDKAGIGSWDAHGRKNSIAVMPATNSYVNSSGETVLTSTDLATAYELAMLYIDGENVKENTLIEDVDTIDTIAEGSARGSTAEWTIVYRYLKYALSDKYDASTGTKTKADVIALIDECYDLAERTGDAAIFNVNHNKLVTARQDALDWVKAANKIKTYKDNKTAVNFVSEEMFLDETGKVIVGGVNKVSTDVYNALKGYYDALMNDYNAFKYSFEEIYNRITEVKQMIDDEELEATDALLKALEDTAYRLSIVDTLVAIDAKDNEYDIPDNDAFTADRFFQGFNRVFTNGGDYGDFKMAETEDAIKVAKSYKDGSYGPNASHYNLQVAYEALNAEVKAQTEVTVLLGDVNADGKVTAADAAAILKNIVNAVATDVAVGDYNKDGSVTAADAAQILKDIVAGVLK